MPVVRKQILAPNQTYWPLGPDGRPFPFTPTHSDIRHFHDQGKAMLSMGFCPAVPLEHQDEAGPISANEAAARSVSHNTGWLKDLYIDDDGGLGGEFDVRWLPDCPEDQIEGRLRDTIKYVSPDIRPVVYVDGQPFERAIAHVALTTSPIWVGQEPFGADGPPPGVQLSRRPVRLSSLTWDFPIRLASGGAPPKRIPKSPERVPLRTVRNKTRLSRGTSMPKDYDDAGDDTPDELDDAGGDNPGEESETPPDAQPETDTGTESGAAAKIAEVSSELADMGLMIDPSKTAEEFLDHLITAIKTHKSTKSLSGDETDQGGGDMPQGAPEPTVVSMSARNKKLQAENATLAKKLSDREFSDFEAEVDALVSGDFLTEEEAADWKGKIGGKRLSLVKQDDSAVKEIMAQVRILTKQMKRKQELEPLTRDEVGTALSARGSPVQKPEYAANSEPDHEVMSRLTGGRWKPPAKE